VEITIGGKGGESRLGASLLPALLHLCGSNRHIPGVQGRIISRATAAIQEALTLAR